MASHTFIGKAKVAVFLLALLPLARLVFLAFDDGLGANPVEFIIRSLGTWTLVMLLVTLGITPLRLVFGLKWPMALRRMLGLYAFFYGSLHLLAYAGLDQWFDGHAIVHDVAKHLYILAGMGAFALMIPLAVTSTQAMVRRLRQKWQVLHRLVYLVAVLGVTHYWWLVKKDITQPLIYAAALCLLLAVRVLHARRKTSPSSYPGHLSATKT